MAKTKKKQSQQELAEKAREWFKNNANRLFMVVMALILGGRIYLFMQEGQYRVPDSEKAQPQQITQIESKVNDTIPSFKPVVDMITPMSDFTATRYPNLLKFNMFDARAVAGAETMVNNAQRVVAQGQQALQAGKVAEAEQFVTQALQINPAQGSAFKLRAEIEKAKTAATATTATAAATPAPPAS